MGRFKELAIAHESHGLSEFTQPTFVGLLEIIQILMGSGEEAVAPADDAALFATTPQLCFREAT